MLSANAAGRKDRAAGANAKLEHRHFAFIASVIRGLDLAPADRRYVAAEFAAACAKTNPRFDTVRFIGACEL